MDSGDSAGGPGGAEPTSGDLSLSAADTVEISDDASAAGFDFDQHRARSVERYGAVRGDYEDWARAVHAVLATALHIEGVTIHSLEYRAKDVYSFGRKSETPDPSDPNRPKYSDPLTAITDMSRVRVITFLLSEVAKTCVVVEREFVVTEKTDKSGLLEEEQRLGYQSVHYLVRFSPARCDLPEYRRFAELVTEIQVRTILQHAWAEIEHDIQYKAVAAIPLSIRRRFTSLAGLLEIADREFQTISNDDADQRTDARRLIDRGELERVEITGDALKAYLDKWYGADGRMSPWGYDWTAGVPKNMGFDTLGDVDIAISGYDDDKVSRAVSGSRQGQLTRFELVLLAAMGEDYIRRHPWYEGDEGWFAMAQRGNIDKLKAAGIDIAKRSQA